jgi:hypothetical protein
VTAIESRISASMVSSVEVDDVHLLADALQRRLGAQSREVRADVAVRLLGDLLEVDLLVQLHVLGVNPEHLQTARSRPGRRCRLSRSKRPKRRSAASIELGRLVAPMTTTCERALSRP